MSFGPSGALRVDPHRVYLLAQIDRVRIEVGLNSNNVGTAPRGVPISQADLADFVGATCEGVAKILAEWRVLGRVAQARGTLRIVDRPAPDAIAHADIN